MSKKLILGSSSPYRKKLLKRLGLPFSTMSPDIDESTLTNETPEAYIERISQAKAQAIYSQLNEESAIIITSDQCATFAGDIIGKPVTAEKAMAQLSRFSGHAVHFLTGLYLFDTATGQEIYSLSEYTVVFRQLTQDEIESYVAIESPLDCAGSFKCEQLGVALFERMEGDDPTALEGLPLIATCKALTQLGLNPLTRQ